MIDGYGGDSGDYILEMYEFIPPVPCILDIDDDEGEPELVDGYLDAWNGGCNSPDFGTPFQSLLADGNGNRTFGGQSGWYDSFIDTDWIIVLMGEYGLIEWTVIAEQETRIFLLGPQDCVDVGIVESIWLDPCEPATMSIQGSPGELIWLWVGPAEFAPPAGFEGHEYNYLCTFTGLYPEGCATDEISFGGIKSLYR